MYACHHVLINGHHYTACPKRLIPEDFSKYNPHLEMKIKWYIRPLRLTAWGAWHQGESHDQLNLRQLMKRLKVLAKCKGTWQRTEVAKGEERRASRRPLLLIKRGCEQSWKVTHQDLRVMSWIMNRKLKKGTHTMKNSFHVRIETCLCGVFTIVEMDIRSSKHKQKLQHAQLLCLPFF